MQAQRHKVSDNPFKQEEIVERVLSYLPPTELKTARLVSVLWAKEGAKQLVKKCFLRITSCLPKKTVKKEKKLQAIEKFSQFLEIFGSSTSLSVVCDKSECSNLMEILKKIPDLGSSIRDLKYTGIVSSPIQDLADLLSKLPNLDALHTSTLNLSIARAEAKKKKEKSNNSSDADSELSEEDSSDDDDGNNSNNHNLDMILNKLKNLYELHLDHFIRTDVELGDYMTHRKKLTAIKSLSLITTGSGENVQRERIFISSSYYWGITNLTWNLDREIAKGLVHEFILELAPTLKYLNITIGEKQSSASPWTDDWYIPYNLRKLKTLEIAGNTEHVKSGIFIALQMTRLEKLVIKTKVNHINLQYWENHHLARKRKLCSQSIKEIQVEKVDVRDTILLSGALWPNLQSAKIGAIILDWRWMNNFDKPFTKSRNLEHLEFDLSDVSFSDLHHYEKWMAGAKCKNLYESGNIEARDHNLFCLRDLRNLKSLTITGAAFVGDFLIYNCFQYLTSLQSLRLQGARVSKQAYDFLKEELNPTTSILFTK